jgi:hypothetical protein
VRGDQILICILAERFANAIFAAIKPLQDIRIIEPGQRHREFPIGEQMQRMQPAGEGQEDRMKEHDREKHAPQEVPALKLEDVGNGCNQRTGGKRQQNERERKHEKQAKPPGMPEIAEKAALHDDASSACEARCQTPDQALVGEPVNKLIVVVDENAA